MANGLNVVSPPFGPLPFVSLRLGELRKPSTYSALDALKACRFARNALQLGKNLPCLRNGLRVLRDIMRRRARVEVSEQSRRARSYRAWRCAWRLAIVHFSGSVISGHPRLCASNCAMFRPNPTSGP